MPTISVHSAGMPLERVASRPTWLLSRANLRAQELLGAAFAAEGLRGYHFRLLAALDQYGPSSQADLGRNTGIDRSDVVAALNELVDDGLARRRARSSGRSPQRGDHLEAGAEPPSTGLDAALDGVQAAVLEPLSAAERRTFVRLLAKLV